MEETALPTCFGEWVKHRRKQLDLTQAELAGRAGCSTPALRKIEAGERRPSKQLSQLLAQSLEIPDPDQPTFIRVARGELTVERLPTLNSRHPSNKPGEIEGISWRFNLPTQLTPLVGRESELTALETLLVNPQCRLLTITGMGGIGKTRVAIELASRQQAAFPGGICFIPLASFNSTEFIVPAIAEITGLSVSGASDPLETLLNLLATRTREPILLLFDNLEHLLVPPVKDEAKINAAGLLIKFLQRLPGLKILVTSLERINIQGEWTFELHGLPFPTGKRTDQIESFSAPALFLQHARQIKSGFTLSEDEQPSLIKICQIVEGNPLAIELAASWIGMLSVDEIAQELGTDLDLLSASMRDTPERHSSLRAALDHSWKLLSAEEQQGLSRLAIFRGGFQREAAEHVAETSLHILMSLHSKSLLLHGEDGRFDLNEIVRRYALYQLSKDSLNKITGSRHGAYYLELARGQDKGLRGPAQSGAVQVLSREMDNFRAAMTWGLEHGQVEQSLQISIALGKFWDTQGYWREGLSWLERGLCSPEPISDAVKAGALTYAGWLAHNLADFPKSVALLRESEQLWRRIKDTEGLSLTLCYLSGSLMHLGDLAGAVAFLDEALELSKKQDYRFGIYTSLSFLGHASSRQGDSQAAIKQFNDALVLASEASDEDRSARLLRALGDEYLLMDEYRRAENYYESAKGIYQTLGNRVSHPCIACNLGYIAIKQGDLVRASELLGKSLQELYELGDRELVLICLAHVALLADEQHLVSRAVRLLGAIDSLNKAMGTINKRLLQKEFDECLTRVQHEIGEAAFSSAWAVGSKMSYEETVRFAVDRPL